MIKNYRLIITSVVLYEMLMIFIFFTGPVCDLIFNVCGLQYFIFGILFPVIYCFTYIWRDKIVPKRISEKNFLSIITGLLFLLGIIYWVASPSIIDLSKTNPFALEAQCTNGITTNKTKNIEQYALQEVFCREVAEEIYVYARKYNLKEVITKRQQKRIIKNVAKKMRSYISMSCEAIASTETEICRSKYNDSNPWGYCTCYGSYLAYLIKKNYDTDYNSEKYLKTKLSQNIFGLRISAEEFCKTNTILSSFSSLDEALKHNYFCGKLNGKL